MGYWNEEQISNLNSLKLISKLNLLLRYNAFIFENNYYFNRRE